MAAPHSGYGLMPRSSVATAVVAAMFKHPTTYFRTVDVVPIAITAESTGYCDILAAEIHYILISLSCLSCCKGRSPKMAHMVTVPVYVLAGGRSLRFGGDKALAEIGGRTLIQHVTNQWAACASRIVAVADHAGKYESVGMRTIADRQPGLGPIGEC